MLISCAGAGLGRLCLEVASLGLEAQGNEFSYYMLLASSFVLNQSARAGQWTVFPWLHTNCNQRCIGDQLRGVSGVTVSGHCCHEPPRTLKPDFAHQRCQLTGGGSVCALLLQQGAQLSQLQAAPLSPQPCDTLQGMVHAYVLWPHKLMAKPLVG